MMQNLDNEIILMEQYKLNPSELFIIRAILMAQDGNSEYLSKCANLFGKEFRTHLESIQSKEIITKAYKMPKPGTLFVPEDVTFNKNFLKKFYRSAFEMGNELFEAYPNFIVIDRVSFNARRVSKKFNDLEDAFDKYGKIIRYDPELHSHIIELVNWGKENNYNFTTLDDFICDRAWTNLEAFRDNNGANINFEATKLI
jgi:hypothetical protein